MVSCPHLIPLHNQSPIFFYAIEVTSSFLNEMLRNLASRGKLNGFKKKEKKSNCEKCSVLWLRTDVMTGRGGVLRLMRNGVPQRRSHFISTIPGTGFNSH